jgi:sporulation protein YlmC with PRC-barrel domain
MLLAATAAAALAASSASAANADKSAKATQAPAADELLRVSEADELLDRVIYDNAGEMVGRLAYLMIDLDRAAVRYAMVRTDSVAAAGEEDTTLVAVPWSMLDIMPYGVEARLKVSKKELAMSPRFQRDQLASFINRDVHATITSYWAPIQDGKAGAQAGAGDAAKQPEDKDGSAQAYMLVGRGYVATVDSADFALASDMMGSEVETAKGKEVGEVDEVVVDLENGRVAYVLLARGGFLGLGEDWTPVPMQALAWNAPSESFRLEVDEAKLRERESFKKSQLPSAVRLDELKQLYDRYGVQPYWTA